MPMTSCMLKGATITRNPIVRAYPSLYSLQVAKRRCSRVPGSARLAGACLAWWRHRSVPVLHCLSCPPASSCGAANLPPRPRRPRRAAAARGCHAAAARLATVVAAVAASRLATVLYHPVIRFGLCITRYIQL